ncbi:MAG: 3',5'-cyclic-nucleotide phosphodiesterase [Dehalococcoidia bacterium]
MNIRFLGTHMYESNSTRLTSILIDDELAVDAGGLTSSLSFTEQERINNILLTHGHYDHIRDIPAIALKNQNRTINIYATKSTLDILLTHLINGIVYPAFAEWPSPERPSLKLESIAPYETVQVAQYNVLAVPVSHAIPAVGYQITDPRGRAVFFSGDTGPGLETCWEYINPQVMIIETAFSNKSSDTAIKPGHLCPGLLEKELAVFRKLHGYLPKVFLIHMDPAVEGEIEREAIQAGQRLDIEITLAREDMVIEV